MYLKRKMHNEPLQRYVEPHQTMMTSSNGTLFHVTGHLCGKFTGPRWIPCTKASDAELWFFSLICAWINDLVNNGEAGELRCHVAHYDVIVMPLQHKINNSGIITYWKTWGHLDGSGHPSVQLSPRQVRRVKPHARDETTSASNGQKAKLLKR